MLVDGQQWLNSEARIRLRLKTDRRSYRCNIPIPSLQNGGNPMYQVSSVNLGVQHIGNVPALSVYPNPANELINIDIKGYVGSVYVEVYDLSGRLLKTSNSFTLSLKDYQKGVYVLRVNFGGRIEKIKFIKK